MKTIHIKRVFPDRKKLFVEYEISSGLETFFSDDRLFEVEYSDDISSVPESVLVIPFVCNVLPIIWLTDATLAIPQLDKEFFQCIENVLSGYKSMSPMLDFKGAVNVSSLIDNSFTPSENCAALFSGGVDAFATLIAHAEEKPRLVTLWGADVSLSDAEGWERVKTHVESTSRDFNLPEPLLVRSNFRAIVKEWVLDGLVASSGDGWWHGYQHGIALLGHAAPVAWLQKWKTLYIASSFTPDNKPICASDPTIDNMLHLVSSRVWHDQYEFHRQQKVGHIVECCRDKKLKVMLRVCWVTRGGTNCCRCEKCQRTIFALLAEGENPAEYGFPIWRQGIDGTRFSIPRHCRYTPRHRKVYAQIQSRFKETKAYINDASINWFYDVDFHKDITIRDWLNDRCAKVRRLLGVVKRKLLTHLHSFKHDYKNR